MTQFSHTGWVCPRPYARAPACHSSGGECRIKGTCQSRLLHRAQAAEGICEWGRGPAALTNALRSTGVFRATQFFQGSFPDSGSVTMSGALWGKKK